MNAFISYSIGENEQYILTILAQKLQESGIALVTSYNQSDYPDFRAVNYIKDCTLFIGLIANSGQLARTERVYSEFKLANLQNKPAIFLIEDTVAVEPWIDTFENTIRFNRHFPEHAIEVASNRIRMSQNSGLQQNSNAAAWILG